MQLLDLSHAINAGISVFPGTAPPVLLPLSTVAKDGFAEMLLTMTTHTATHIDAPCHLLPNGKTLDAFPVDKFYGPAICIDCAGAAGNAITPALLETYARHLAGVEFVLFHTGWSAKWRTEAYCRDFPVLTPESARWLTRFNLKGIGVDTLSVDAVDSTALPNHHALLGREVLIVENLTNLSGLGAEPFAFSCLPLRIDAADGSPVRAVAILPGESARPVR